MKKLLVLLFGLFLCGAVHAQKEWFKATEFAYKYVNNGYWTDWSEWIDANVNIEFDIAKDMIVIYSSDIQIYKVVEQVSAPYDSKGQQIKYRVVDQDFDYGYIRLRVQNNGERQIYVDFSNVSWVYNIEPY